MAKSKSNINPWYFILSLALVTVVSVFIFNYYEVEHDHNYSKIQESIAQPLTNKIDTNTIENLKKKLSINNDELTGLKISSRNVSSSSAIMNQMGEENVIQYVPEASSSSQAQDVVVIGKP